MKNKAMKNKAMLLLLLAVIPFTAAYLQEVHIYYNLFNDSVIYKKDGHIVKAPKLRQGDEILLHLTELNNFLYDIELDVQQETYLENAGMPDLTQLPGLGGFGLPPAGGGDGMTDPAGGMGLMDIPLLTLNDHSITLGSLFEKSRGPAEQANTLMQEIYGIRNEVQVLLEEVKGLERAATVSEIAMTNLEAIKTNPALKPSTIKRLCQEYYANIFRKPTATEISLNDLLNAIGGPQKYAGFIGQLKSKQNELDQKVALLGMIAEQIMDMEMEDPEFARYSKDLVNFRRQSSIFNTTLQEAIARTGDFSGYPSTPELNQLQFSLAEVISNDFTYHSRIKVEADKVVINIKVIKKQLHDGEEEATMKTRSLFFDVKGGIKITASMGLGFGQFFTPGEEFSVRNDEIVAENAGAFSPSATTFLHFYSYSARKVSLAGSFGLGFPMLGDAGNQAIQFFAGPSLFIGTKQRMILTGGLMGGRVTRLSKGFQVGDSFDPYNGDIPTRNPYELGFFIGTSFNLGGG